MKNNLLTQVNLLLEELEPVRIKQERLIQIQEFSLDIARKLDEEMGTGQVVESKIALNYLPSHQRQRKPVHKSLLYLQSLLKEG